MRDMQDFTLSITISPAAVAAALAVDAAMVAAAVVAARLLRPSRA